MCEASLTIGLHYSPQRPPTVCSEDRQGVCAGMRAQGNHVVPPN